MKITNGPVKKRQEELRAEANKGCDVCPCCGSRHLGVPTYKKWWSLFFSRQFRIDCFRCLDCGAEWEGDKYEI